MPNLQEYHKIVEEMSVYSPYSSFGGVTSLVDETFSHGDRLGIDCGLQSLAVTNKMAAMRLKAHVIKARKMITAATQFRPVPTEHRASLVFREGRTYIIDLSFPSREMLDITDLQVGEEREFKAFPNTDQCQGTVKVFLDDQRNLRTQWCYPFKTMAKAPVLTYVYDAQPEKIEVPIISLETYKVLMGANLGFYTTHFVNTRDEFVRVFVKNPGSETSELGIRIPMRGHEPREILTGWDDPCQEAVDEIERVSERIGVEPGDIIAHHQDAHANMLKFLESNLGNDLRI